MFLFHRRVNELPAHLALSGYQSPYASQRHPRRDVKFQLYSIIAVPPFKLERNTQYATDFCREVVMPA